MGQFMKIINNGKISIKCKHFQLICNKTNICDDYCIKEPDTEGSETEGTFEGHTFAVFKGTDFNYETYRQDCINRGGYLAIPDSPEKDAYIYSLIRDLGFDTAYFGVWRNPNDTTKWYYEDGRPATYQNWASGEPNNSGGEYYGMYYYKYTNGKWNDGTPIVTQGQYQYYICEWDY